MAQKNSNSPHLKQSKISGNKRLLILQSYVFKPDILSDAIPHREDFGKIKLPMINNKNIPKKENNNDNNFGIKNMKNEMMFRERNNKGHKISKNLKLKQSLQSLKSHIRDPSEFLHRKSFHKTKFLINKEGPENISHLKHIFRDYIDNNKFYKNEEVYNFPEYEKTAILSLNQLKFSEKLDEDQSIMMQNYGWPTGNIKKNRLILENLFLKRLEMKEKSKVFEINNTLEDD